MRRSNRRLTVMLVALIVLAIAVTAWTALFGSARYQRAQLWSEIVQRMQTDVLASHLALAEYLAGDDEIDPSTDVVSPVTDAVSGCLALRDGAEIDGLSFRPLPVLASDAGLAGLCRELEDLRRSSQDRLGGGVGQGEGTEADGDFDELFDNAVDRLDTLDTYVNQTRRADERLVERVSWTIVVTLLLLLAGILLVGRRVGRNIAELGRRNQVVLDAAGDGIYGLDATGTGVFANPAAARLTGCARRELVGRGAHAALHGDDDVAGHSAAECPVLEAMGHREVSTREDVVRRADGTTYPAEYTASPVADDPATAGVIVFRDISDRRQVESMKNQFVSMVSHELRTPLTSIHGSLGLLSGGALGEMPASAQRMLTIATTNTDRLVRLINDILDIERMESGAVRMQRDVIDAAEVVEQAVASMRSMADQAGVELATAVEPVLVWADQDRLTQVLVNLIGNAVKFSPSPSTVTISLTPDGDDALFGVRDQGRGIPADKLTAIFGRFQQVDASDSRAKGGTGLGLAISESIVTQHDGQIWVESELGQGSLFRVRIPAVRRRSVPARTPGGDPVDAAQDRDRRTVLVVDDDHSVLEVVCTILDSRGYRAVGVSSGAEALARVAEEPPDAVVLDLIMPGTGGWEVLGALRENPATADVPVVILSILTERDEPPAPSSYDAWVRKPFDDQSLTSVLERAISSRHGPLRAVVIEDDEDLAAVLTARFASHGVDARHAGTVEAARRVVPEVDPDLLVLDLRLPDGEGATLLRELRADGGLRGVPVVVYTGYDIESEDRSQLDRDGAIVFTKTRVTPEEFERRVLELVGALTMSGAS